MYWNEDLMQLSIDLHSWIVTLDVLKLIHNSFAINIFHRWIVTLDVLKCLKLSKFEIAAKVE